MALSEQEVEFGTNFMHVMSTMSAFAGVSSLTVHALGSPMENLPVGVAIVGGLIGIAGSIGMHFLSRFGALEAITIEKEQEERRLRYIRQAEILGISPNQ